MNQHDPILDGLDRLAAVADTDPVGDRLPGIQRRVRATRRRNAAVAVTGVAAVAALGVGLGTTLGSPDAGRDPGVANSGSTSGSQDPDQLTEPPSTSPEDTEPGVPTEVAEERTADVDGDGADDRIELLVPRGAVQGDPYEAGWLRLATGGATYVIELGDQLDYYGLGDPVDVDGDGDSEVLTTISGGDGLIGTVHTWGGDGLVEADVAPGTPQAIGSQDRLVGSAEFSGWSVQDGGLWSWRLAEYAGGPEATTWRWELDGTTLRAVEQPGTKCVSLGVIEEC